MSDTIKPANRIPSLLAAICFALAALLFPIHRLIMRISCLNDASFYTLENFLIGIGRSFLSDFTTIHGLIYIAY
ncbi:MAG: hypothetical protein IKV35_03930, partial [Clostridia bacterium]|nr:hypothetical protein [Clostridia bacterium]